MNKLILDKTNKKLLGVCGGLAKWANIDVSLVRIGFVIATLLGAGSPVLIYVILGFILD